MLPNRAIYWLVAVLWLPVTAVSGADIRISPPAILLESPEASQQVLISEVQSPERRLDLTRDVQFAVEEPSIAKVSSRGVVQPLREGKTQLIVRRGSETWKVPLEVRGLEQPPGISFEHEIIPILTKSRCNSGGCHGKAEGQNGFKLSVFGFDPVADHDALVKEGQGRRLFPTVPRQSLLLRKGTADVPHGGGKKIDKNSLHYQRLVRWIREGCQFNGSAGPVVAIEIEPADRLVFAGETQQLRVTAREANGRTWCVTQEAEYESNAETIAHVDPQGLIQAGNVPGEASILVRYMGQVAICRVTHPQRGIEFTRPPVSNFIDGFVWDKLEKLKIVPSDLCDDATFLRRAALDVTGTLPTADEARAFLADTDPQKRSKLVDKLLLREEYAVYWALRWADILRVDQDKVSPQGAVAITRWLQEQFAKNRPYDEFARDIVLARGDTFAVGPASVYRALDTPEVISRSFSQLFLGVRIECAQCHHHPFEKWGQEDYYALGGFFTGVSTKGLPNGNTAVILKTASELKHPRTNKDVPAHALGAATPDFTGVTDRRQPFADWMTAPDNPYFARTIVNRLWAHYLGRGLIEPIDDLRATNPATNEPLLAALEKHLRDVKYDLRTFTRTLLNSRTYQLASQTNDSNLRDYQNFSHAQAKALPAEVLLDAISQATGVPEKFNGWPEGYRAIQIWDNRLQAYFFRIFGRPARLSVCECERSNEPSIAQALHLMNSPEITSKIQAAAGRARRLRESDLAPEAIIDDLYFATLSRAPTPTEKKFMLAEYAQSERLSATEDILWALINSKEFLYNH